jgi:pimeloyl-ACP methyl ester carboxylesterase
VKGVVVAAAIYLGLCLLLYVLQGRLIYFPNATPAVGSQYATLEIAIDSDGIELKGWFLHQGVDREHPLLIYYGGNAEDVSLNLGDRKLLCTPNALLMNYRGYGGTAGRPQEEDLYRDALRVFDHIQSTHGISEQDIVLMGRSLGSGVATYVASKREVRGVILSTGYDSIRAVAERHYPIFPVGLLLNQPFDSISRAPKIKAPLLNLVAQNDRIIPSAHSQRLAKAWGGPTKTVLIEDADHNNIQNYRPYWKAMNDFLCGASESLLENGQ